MVQYKDRRVMRQELASSGYSMEYLDDWQPKTTLYRHAPGMDVSGGVAFPVGSEVRNVPGNPDYVIRKARIGMLPYPPSDACTCRWCSGRTQSTPDVIPVEVSDGLVACEVDGCDWRGKKPTLRTHRYRKHK